MACGRETEPQQRVAAVWVGMDHNIGGSVVGCPRETYHTGKERSEGEYQPGHKVELSLHWVGSLPNRQQGNSRLLKGGFSRPTVDLVGPCTTRVNGDAREILSWTLLACLKFPDCHHLMEDGKWQLALIRP
jgi:hypothetical protein